MHLKPSHGEKRAAQRHSGFLARFLSAFSRPLSRPHDTRRAQRHLRRFISYYRPHLPLFGAVLCGAVLVAITATSLPLIANYMVSRVAEPGSLTDNWQALLAPSCALLAIFIIQALTTYFVDYKGHVMGAKIEAQVRRDLFAHCQALSFSFYDRQRTGQLMSRITHDSLWLGELFHHGPEDLTISLLKFGGVVAVLFWVDAAMAWLVLAAVPFALAYAAYFNGRMKIALRASKERMAAINERVEDALGGIRVVQSFANEAEELRRFDRENQRFLASRRDGYRSEALLWSGMDGFAQLVTIMVIVVGAMRVAMAELAPADIVTLLLCIGVLMDPIRRIDNFIRLWQLGHTGFVRVMELLDEYPAIVDRPAAKSLASVAGAISFDAVRFRYETGGRVVFNDLNLKIAPGEFVALVGPSGVGKSTLCSLVPRFYDVEAGAVRIDGQDVRDISLASLRRNIGVVQQDVYLFAGTIADNLRYGRPEAGFAEIVAAARAADAHDFIMALPQGYDTDIGQRGTRLSGGQKQRLTIARAVLKDPPLLIFDEATSALDSQSEGAVQAALLRLAKGRTTIVIAHRLSTIRHADRILVLTEHGIVEDGPHDALMAKNGVYAQLQAAQGRI